MMQASHPADYRITVEGTLDPMWLPCLSGFVFAESQPPEHLALTRLEGRVVDQAALQGVLDTLFMLGMRLVLVEYLPPAT